MRLLICAQEPLGPRMAGPAIRAQELARALGATLAAPAGGDVPFHPHDPGPLRAALRDADAVLTPPLWPRLVAAIRHADIPWICDLYAPEPLETLEHFRDKPSRRRLMHALAVDRLDDAVAHASLLLCASRAQRDLWTGAALRALTPDAYDADPALERILELPFGLPQDPPQPDGHPLRERFGIAADAPVVVWNGGTWPWLDPAAAVEAVRAHPRAELVFLGGADDRVTPGDRVHVNDEWVPYADRGAWLLDADAAISAHHDHLETRYAFRTRLVDAIWAGLPIVCTGGDELSDRVVREDLGAVAGPGRVEALADGLAAVLDAGRDAYRDRLAAAASQLTWPVLAAPLAARLPELAPPAGTRGAALRPRTLAYRTLRPALDRVGLRDWPRA